MELEFQDEIVEDKTALSKLSGDFCRLGLFWTGSRNNKLTEDKYIDERAKMYKKFLKYKIERRGEFAPYENEFKKEMESLDTSIYMFYLATNPAKAKEINYSTVSTNP